MSADKWEMFGDNQKMSGDKEEMSGAGNFRGQKGNGQMWAMSTPPPLV